MEILNTVFTFVSNNILTKAEFFVGLIVLVGYILLGRKWYETLAGFLKAVVGYMILNVGSAGLINTFRPILAGLNQKFHLNAVVIDPYFGLNAVNAALENIGLSAAWTMTSLLLAFIWNIILLIFRKFTKLRTLLLTGHIMVQQATTVTWIVFLFIPGLRNIWGAVAVGILVGTYQAVFSNLTVEPTDRLTDGEGGFAIGHQQMFAIWLADKIFIVTSGENMAIHAGANIAMAVENFKNRGYATLGGLILNRRNVLREEEKVEELAEDFHTSIVGTLTRSDLVQQAEEQKKTVLEAFPESEMAEEYRILAKAILMKVREKQEVSNA